MKIYLGLLMVIAMFGTAVAGDDEAGASLYLAKGCISCHGSGGHSPDPTVYPKTAGLDADYIVAQLNAFRQGNRHNPMMSPMAATLSDQEITALAAYLAAQK